MCIRDRRQQGLADDFLYSDEALFEKSIRRPRAAHFKPDYAPDYLLCCCLLYTSQKDAFACQIHAKKPP